MSTSQSRRSAWSAAAELQAWEALICRDAGEFRKAAHAYRTPLIVVDLPPEDGSLDYRKLTRAVDEVREMSDALIAICGAGESPREETWARTLGSWTYLNGVGGQAEMELLLGEARIAIGRLRQLQRPMPGGGPAAARPTW